MEVKRFKTNGADKSLIAPSYQNKEVDFFFMNRDESMPLLINLLDIEGIVAYRKHSTTMPQKKLIMSE